MRIVLEQPATARFIVRKLYQFLISEKPFRPTRCSSRSASRFAKAITTSRRSCGRCWPRGIFYSNHAFRQRIKGPVEYVLGAVQAVYRRYGEDAADYRSLPQSVLVPWLASMGQILFEPPNVKGWPGGTVVAQYLDDAGPRQLRRLPWRWARSGRTSRPVPSPDGVGCHVRRAGLAVRRSSSPPPADMPEEPAPALAFDPARVLVEEGLNRPEEIVDALLGRLRAWRAAPFGASEARGVCRRRPSHGPCPGPARARGRPCHSDPRRISISVRRAHFTRSGVPNMLTRRQLLTHTLQGSSLVALSSIVPQFVSRTAHAAAPGKDTILVVLEMTGGNDGLNTVIPYADDLYHKARPTLRQTKEVVIRLDDHVGLNSGMVGFRSMWEKGQLAVVQGVGYPNPERSHFEAMDIWQSGDTKPIAHRLVGPGRG